MSSIVRAGSAAEFLALVPHLLGCTPRRSLAVVTFASGRSLGALRIDLPDPVADDVESIASTVIGMACKVPRTDAIAAIVYTDARLADATDVPHRPLVDALLARADICGLRVTDALIVGPDGWDAFASPSPDGPRPLREIATTPEVPGSSDVEADQFAAAKLPTVPADEVSAVHRLLDDVARLLSGSVERGPRAARRRAAAVRVLDDVSDPPGLFERFVAREAPIDSRLAAAVAFCLQRPALRDVALVQWAGNLASGDAAYGAQWAHADGLPFPGDLARPLWGEGAHPDPPRLLRALERCRRVAAATPSDGRAGPLAACAWLAWATGRSTHAATYAMHALAIEPGHGLAGIVRTMADHGRLPEWVFERQRATSPAETGLFRGSRGR